MFFSDWRTVRTARRPKASGRGLRGRRITVRGPSLERLESRTLLAADEGSWGRKQGMSGAPLLLVLAVGESWAANNRRTRHG